MTQLREINNREFLKELKTRIKTKQIKEEKISRLLETRKKQRLAGIWRSSQRLRRKWRTERLRSTRNWKLGWLVSNEVMFFG